MCTVEANSGQFSYPLPNMVHPLEGSVQTPDSYQLRSAHYPPLVSSGWTMFGSGYENCPEFGVVCGPELVTVRSLLSKHIGSLIHILPICFDSATPPFFYQNAPTIFQNKSYFTKAPSLLYCQNGTFNHFFLLKRRYMYHVWCLVIQDLSSKYTILVHCRSI
jgi:hypothetical protein